MSKLRLRDCGLRKPAGHMEAQFIFHYKVRSLHLQQGFITGSVLGEPGLLSQGFGVGSSRPILSVEIA